MFGGNDDQLAFAQNINEFPATNRKHREIFRNYKFKKPATRAPKTPVSIEFGIPEQEIVKAAEEFFHPCDDVAITGKAVGELYQIPDYFADNNYLYDQIRANLMQQKYEQLTSIQKTVIPLVLGGSPGNSKQDLIVCGRSGSGKTLAYMVPIINYCQSTVHDNAVTHRKLPHGAHRSSALILLKSGHAAVQVFARMEKIAQKTDVIIKPLIGKFPKVSFGQEGVDVIVATPGRLLDHLHADPDMLDDVKCLVLDDADLFMVEYDWQKAITLFKDKLLNKKAQIVCVSCGYSVESLQAFKDFVKPNYVYIDMAALNKVESTIHQRFIDSGFKNKTEMVEKILLEKSVDDRYPKTIIFCSSREVARLLSCRLKLSSSLPESFRPRVSFCHGGHWDPSGVFNSFNLPKGALTDDKGDDGMEIDVLVACDGLSFGVITLAELVINFDFPVSLCSYSSRMGRLRRNSDGEIVTFVDTHKLVNKCPRRIKDNIFNILRAARDAKAYLPSTLQSLVDRRRF